MKEEFLNKTGRAIQSISCDLVLMKEGSQMPVISELVEKYDFARGTIQNALNYLRDEKLIVTINRGSHGTILSKIDYERLYSIILDGNIRGTMPLPYSKLYEGFATGLYENFKQKSLPLSLAYIRGSKERIVLVEERKMHFSVVSKLAAEKSIADGFQITVLKEFGINSYLSEHVMIFANAKHNHIEDDMRVGIDYNSFDQQLLTQEAVGNKKIKYIEVPSHQLVQALKNGTIDVGIWNFDEIKDSKLEGIHYAHLKNSQIDLKANTAVIISNSKDTILNKILSETIDIKLILDIQNDVVAGNLLPQY